MQEEGLVHSSAVTLVPPSAFRKVCRETPIPTEKRCSNFIHQKQHSYLSLAIMNE